MNKHKNKKKRIAFLLSVLMLVSLFGNISYTPIAEGDTNQTGIETATVSDAGTQPVLEEPVLQEFVEASEVVQASEASFTISDLKCYVTKDGTKIDLISNPSTSISQSEPMELAFNWHIQNGTHIRDLEFDLGAVNIKLNSVAESVLTNSSGTRVGVYRVDSATNKIYVTLDESTAQEDNIYGTANFNGTADGSNTGSTTVTDTEFRFGGSMFTVPVTYNPSSVNVSKQASGKAYKDTDGDFVQKYTININVSGGQAEITDASDIIAPSSVITATKNVTVNIDGTTTTYASIDAAAAAIKNHTYASGTNIGISYDAVLGGDNLKYLYYQDLSDAGLSGSERVEIEAKDDNKFEIVYKSTDGNTKTNSSTTYSVNVSKPGVSKSGSWQSATSQVVNWTVTLNTGDFDKTDISSISDTIDTTKHTLVDADALTKMQDLANWTDNGNGTYTYTYQTKVEDSVYNSAVPTDIVNTVDVTFDKYGKTYPYNSSQKVTTPGGNLISKADAPGIDADGYMKWNLSVSIPDVDMHDVVITDSPQWATNELSDSTGMDRTKFKVEIDGILVYENGTSTAEASGYIGNNKYAEVSALYGNCYIPLKDSFVNANRGSTILMTVYTKALDEALQLDEITFKNRANLSYLDVSNNQISKDSNDATYRYVKKVNKTGVTSTTYRNAIDYTASVNVEGNYVNGDQFIFTDILPTDMELIEDSLSLTYMHTGGWNEDKGAASNMTLSYNGDGNPVVTVTSTAGDLKTIVIKYTAKMKQSVLKDYVLAGVEKTFTNTVSVDKNNSSNHMGDATIVNNLTPGKVVDKSGSYTTGRQIDYTVIINPDQIQFNATPGGSITGIDDCGYQLIPDKSSVTAYEYIGTGNPEADKDVSSKWSVISSGFYYTFKKLEGGKTRTIFTLPDGKAIKLKYSSTINVYTNLDDGTQNGYLTPEGSSNSFYLQGQTSDATKTNTSFSLQVSNSSMTATSNLQTITLYKYWTDSHGNLVALNGSEFALYECEYNRTTKTIINPKKTLKQADITLEAGKSVVAGLNVETVYALYETKADPKFKRNTEPYYFVILDSATTAGNYPSTVDTFFNYGITYYENEKGANVDLKVKKTFDGSSENLTADAYSFKIEKVKDVADETGACTVVSGSDAYEEVVTNDAAGNVAFTSLAYDKSDLGEGNTPKTYYYKITEVEGSDDTVEYDHAFYIVKAQLSYDDADDSVAVDTSVTKYVADGSSFKKDTSGTAYTVHNLAFANKTKVSTYIGSFEFSAIKKLDGQTDYAADDVYTFGNFVVDEVSGDSATATVKKANISLGTTAGETTGEVTFATKAAYSSAVTGDIGTHYYKIYEKSSGYTDVTKDSNYYILTVKVAKDSETTPTKLVATCNKITKYDSEGNASVVTGTSLGNVVFDNETVKTEIQGTKTWVGDTEADRPASIRVTLYRLKQGGTAGTSADWEQVGVSKTVTSSATGDWTYSFGNQPKYYAGTSEVISYKVVEAAVSRYTTSYVPNTYDIRNTLNVMSGELSFKAIKKLDNTTNYATKYTFAGFAVDELHADLSVKTAEVATGTTAGSTNGTVTFTPAIAYDSEVSGDVGTHYYKIYEKASGYAGVAKDSSYYIVKVDVAKDIENNKLDVNVVSVQKYSGEGLVQGTAGTSLDIVIFDNTTIKTSVSGTKTWNDTGYESCRPDSIELTLYRLKNGTTATWEEVTSKTIATTGSSQNYTFDNLDKYYAGTSTIITYKVEETPVVGYTTTINGYDIENTLQTTKLDVNKVWDDNDDEEHARPDSLTVFLLENGVASSLSAVTLNEANNWTAGWDNLPIYKNGAEVKYSVSEGNMPIGYSQVGAPSIQKKSDGSYTAVITNRYSMDKVSHTVVKVWDDDANRDGLRPESIEVQLCANGSPLADEVKVLSDGNDWTYTWNNLDKVDTTGTDIIYTVVEVGTITGYTALTSESGTTTTITNTHSSKKRKISVYKTWVDDGTTSRPDSVSVQLYANGEARFSPVTLNDANSWRYEWTNLPYNNNGTKIDYTVKEVAVPTGYGVSYGQIVEDNDGNGTLEVVNSYPSTSRTVTKIWDDYNNQELNPSQVHLPPKDLWQDY